MEIEAIDRGRGWKGRIWVGALTFSLLAMVQVMPKKPLLLLERFVESGGWLQVFLFTIYAVWLFGKMIDRKERDVWRRRTWLFFSLFFFAQLIFGVVIDTLFLMSGKLHFPIPGIILGGAIYRGTFGFMPILFLVTLLLSGPAWCSHLCYFGAWDNWAAVQHPRKEGNWVVSPKMRLVVLVIFSIVALMMRFVNTGEWIVSLLALLFGIGGVGMIWFVSRKKGAMAHCTLYCPIGTLVSYLKKVSPFRFAFSAQCTKCMACLSSCRYGALTKQGIKGGKIGVSCTYCGDCMKNCRHNGFEYRFLRMSATHAEMLWLVVTIVLHAVFMAIARI